VGDLAVPRSSFMVEWSSVAEESMMRYYSVWFWQRKSVSGLFLFDKYVCGQRVSWSTIDVLLADICAWPDFRHVPRCVWMVGQETCGGRCMLIYELAES